MCLKSTQHSLLNSDSIWWDTLTLHIELNTPAKQSKNKKMYVKEIVTHLDLLFRL